MKCKGPDCDLEVYTRGVCRSHYQQMRRCEIANKPVVLKPLRHGKGIQIPAITVGKSVADALMKKGPTLYRAAQSVLVEWASRRRK